MNFPLSLVVLFLVTLGVGPGPAADRGIILWTTDALVKVRPSDAVPSQPEHQVHLWAARNEFEPFQIILRAESRAIHGVDVEVTDLSGEREAILAKENVTIYLEKYIRSEERRVGKECRSRW